MRLSFLTNRRGSILILALWTLGFLGVFALHVGIKIRQRMALVSRIEDRSRLRLLADAGIKKGLAAVKKDIQRNNNVYTSRGKSYRHNNPELFLDQKLGQGRFSVYYEEIDPVTAATKRFHGVVDEERRLNLNVADRRELVRLISDVTAINDELVEIIADAVVDWREIGVTQPKGFYSDDYYSNLRYPYQPKDTLFEVIEEVKLLQGVDERVYEQLRPYVTVYGNGQVNINTATGPVLMALGLNGDLVSKILFVRRGADERESTYDDHVFLKTYDIASEMSQFVKMTPNEVAQIDLLNAEGRLKTNSSYYYVQSKSRLRQGDDAALIECVYNADDNRIEYWREKIQ